MVNKSIRDKESDRDGPDKKHRKSSTVNAYELPVIKLPKEDVYVVGIFLLSVSKSALDADKHNT